MNRYKLWTSINGKILDAIKTNYPIQIIKKIKYDSLSTIKYTKNRQPYKVAQNPLIKRLHKRETTMKFSTNSITTVLDPKTTKKKYPVARIKQFQMTILIRLNMQQFVL